MKNRNIFAFIIVFALLGCLFLSFDVLGRRQNEDDYVRVEDNLRRSILTCYSIEGEYPESLDYLMENYGLYFNRDLYQIHFRYLGENIMPEYKVFRKGSE